MVRQCHNVRSKYPAPCMRYKLQSKQIQNLNESSCVQVPSPNRKDIGKALFKKHEAKNKNLARRFDSPEKYHGSRVRHFVPISRFPKNIQSTLLIHFPCKFHIIEIENKWKSRPTSESGWWLGTFFIVPSIWIDQSN